MAKVNSPFVMTSDDIRPIGHVALQPILADLDVPFLDNPFLGLIVFGRSDETCLESSPDTSLVSHDLVMEFLEANLEFTDRFQSTVCFCLEAIVRLQEFYNFLCNLETVPTLELEIESGL